MSFNGSGAFSINSSGQPVVEETLITSAAFNAFTADVATGLSTAICKDGQTTITANIPLSGFKLTGVGAATARTDAATLASIQDGTGVYVATVGGTADVITLTPSPAITAYAAGQTFRFIASGANTTNVTVAISGLTAQAITKNGTTALAAGDIPSGTMVSITYDGTRFILGTPRINVSTFGATLIDDADAATARTTLGAAGSGAATGSGLTMATARLLGRTTGSTGAIEEISVAASLTLSGGSLSGTAASEGQAGVVELATQTEVNTMTDTARALTPNHNKVVIGTLTASTSGTSIDFTSIPAGVRKITITFQGVSTNGTSFPLVQIGDAGGIEPSGYVGAGANLTNASSVGANNSTAGLLIDNGADTATVLHGVVRLSLMDAATFLWAMDAVLSRSNLAAVAVSSATKALSAVLDRVRITTVNGTDAFDAGSINILYER